MATLYFKVSSDYEEVIRLRQECEKLEAQLLKMDKRKSPGAVASMETQLASTRQQMMGLVTEAAKAGAVMENDLKKKISSTTKASEELSEDIGRSGVNHRLRKLSRIADGLREACGAGPASSLILGGTCNDKQ